VSVTPGEDRVVPPADAADERPLEWTDNPWRHKAASAILGIALTGLTGYLVWGFAGARLPYAVLLLAFSVSLSPGFVPTRYRVDARGVARRVWFAWHRREWTSIRRAVVRHAPPLSPRIWLSSETRPGPLENLRGISLSVPRYLPDHDRLFRELRHRLALHGL
jgi:hypothetical protein